MWTCLRRHHLYKEIITNDNNFSFFLVHLKLISNIYRFIINSATESCLNYHLSILYSAHNRKHFIDSFGKLLLRFRIASQGKMLEIKLGVSFRGIGAFRILEKWNIFWLWAESNLILLFHLLIINDHISSITVRCPITLFILASFTIELFMVVFLPSFQLINQDKVLFFPQDILNDRLSKDCLFMQQMRDSLRKTLRKLLLLECQYIPKEDF